MRAQSLLAGLAWSLLSATAFAAEPAPQYTVEDLQKSFAQPAGAAAPDAGSCEAQGMATGPDGTCLPSKKSSRGFNLVGSGNQPRTAAPPTSAPGSRPAGNRASGARPAATVAASRPATRDLLISFDNNSAVLTDQAKANARVFAQAVNSPALAGARFQIEGHTNAVGSRALNRDLSRARAEALVSFLAGEGVDRSRLLAQGYGFDRPLNRADPRAPENRRVEARRLQ